jgi:enamine deaminase RidA (YjgF/YER057c/UK114 family)
MNIPHDQSAEHAGSIENRLMALGLTLPAPSAPAFQYVPVVIHRDVAYVSGQLPRMGERVVRAGKVGREVSVEHAQNAARICILQGLACLKQALGSLDQVKRILKVTGFVASAQGFVDLDVRTAAIISISTGELRGNSATPTAERACRPASPNRSTRSCEAASMTAGCSTNP